MTFSKENKARLALICRPGHEWKFDKLRAMLPDSFESDVFLNRDIDFDDIPKLSTYDLVFYKSKDPRFLSVMEELEKKKINIVVNQVDAVRLTRHRRSGARATAKVGVPIASDYIGPLSGVPFEKYVIKGEYEDDPMIPIFIDSPQRRDELLEEWGEDREVYAQDYLGSYWEYKYYCAAGEIFAFRQRPALINPDKMATRESTDKDPQLVEYTLRAMESTGLDLIGVDFLYDDQGHPFLTDINSIQGLQNFQAGREALIRYFKRRLNIA